ncbi:MAG TPA: methionine ABC transporter ATP-binding protein [Syntrophomonas sp.]|nr:methionine ABC transporter ATP-binding protein [Syntrophomonas sp.]HPT68912.1 methionine ABC transporter ATP-binding protein [Syntrophomonas sp.]
MIQIEGLTKIYNAGGGDVLALENVSLQVNKGEIFGIIGLSGAGKSTLIRCINMLEKPTAGTIRVDGQNISSLDKRELRAARQKIGMIFQQFNLLSSRTVFDNIMFPLEIAGIPPKDARKRVQDLLDLVGLNEKALVYPEQLSGGQKQRVGIARALANDPKILLSDEATSALDPQTTRSILKLLKDINKQLNLTILLITHDMNVIKETCDRVAVIDNSKIVEIGDVLNIFSNPGTPTSKSFINTIINKEIPEELLHRWSVDNDHETSKLIRASFIGASAGEPVISGLIKKFDIKANILYGNIDRVKDTPFGNLTLELIGDPSLMNQALDYLRENGLEIEVL